MVEVAVVEPTVVVFTPAPVPILMVLAVASVARLTVPPFAVIPANVKVCVVPEPSND